MVTILEKEVRKAILEKITPTLDEINHQKKVITQLKTSLERLAKKIGIRYEFIEAQGSTGKKQTQLRGTADVDLFVGLNPSDFPNMFHAPLPERKKLISAQFEKLVDTWFIPAAKEIGATDILKSYSQHPYLSTTINGIDTDVIACFYLDKETLQTEGPITAVDRTIHHTNFVCSHINQRLREDIRILKSFVRASYAYGDSCAIGRMGFTGYAIEVLVILGNGLEKAMRMLMQLETRPIDPFGRSEKVLRENQAFRDDYVIIIDPTDRERNVAASFSPRSVRWVVKRLNYFQKIKEKEAPEKIVDLFVEKPLPVNSIPSWISPHVIVKEFSAKGDVHYTLIRDKLYRVGERIQRRLQREKTGEERFGDVLFEVYFEELRFALGFVVEKQKISEVYSRRGPPIHLSFAVKSFREKHKDAYEKNGFLWIDVKRRYTEPKEMIESLLTKFRIRHLQPIEQSNVSVKLANVLYKYIMRLERDFALSNRQEYIAALETFDW